jgi:uncharacterized protein YukE
MPLLHIEVEQLQITAQSLRLASEQIDWQIQRMENTRQSLQASWQADGRLHFEDDMNHHLHNLRRLSQEIAELSVRLQREALKWEQIGYRF